MKRTSVFLKILVVAIVLTILGFIADSGEYVPDLKTNVIDFVGMTALFFTVISAFYWVWGFFRKRIIQP
jgi:hypothetical protein